YLPEPRRGLCDRLRRHDVPPLTPIRHSFPPIRQIFAPIRHSFPPIRQIFAPVRHLFQLRWRLSRYARRPGGGFETKASTRSVLNPPPLARAGSDRDRPASWDLDVPVPGVLAGLFRGRRLFGGQ